MISRTVLSSARLLFQLRLVRCLPLCLLLACFVWGAGCTGKGSKAEVKGKVTLNGKNVEGTVWFTGPDGKKASGPLLGGAYTIYEAPIGMCKVSIEGMGAQLANSIGAPKDSSNQKDASAFKDKSGGISIGVSPPKKYASPDTSGLTFEVKSGKSEKNFELAE